MAAEGHDRGWLEPDGGWRRPGAVEVVAWAALVVGLVVSRLVVAPEVLYDWDSVNYALGIRSFDVYEHQPHAPGYPVFIGLLKAFSWLPGPPSAPFLAVNALLGTGALLLLGSLVRRRGGPVVAWVTAACFAVCPPFWYQGAIAAAYVAECFSSLLVAWTALWLARRRLPPWAAAVLFALAVGIRPNSVVTLGPVLALGVLFRRPSWRELGTMVAAFAAACLLWFLPLVIGGGGWARYREASDALMYWQLQLGSVFAGDFSSIDSRGSILLLYLVDALNLLLIVPVVHGLAGAIRGGVGWRTPLFLATWFLPGAALYAGHHLAKSGYVLTLVPVLFVAVGLAAATALRHVRWQRAWRVGTSLLAALYLLVNVAGFLLAVPAEQLERRDAPFDLLSRVVITGDYGRAGLQYRTWGQHRIREVLDDLDPERDLAVFAFGTHGQHRLATFTHPDHWLLATSALHERAFSLRGQPPWNDTFGDYQVALLRHPVLDIEWEEPLQVDLQGDTLHLHNQGHELHVELERTPRRVILFVSCPPCAIETGPGIEAADTLSIGGGYAGWEISAR